MTGKVGGLSAFGTSTGAFYYFLGTEANLFKLLLFGGFATDTLGV
jgi:hypothetical protein